MWLLRHRRLAPHTVIRVTVSAPAANSKTLTLKVMPAGKLRRSIRSASSAGLRTSC